MFTSKQVRKRLAVVVAGALLASALVTSVAPVAADGEDNAPSAEQRDNHAGQDENGAAAESRLTVTSVEAPVLVAPVTEAAPAQDVPLSQGRDDYNG